MMGVEPTTFCMANAATVRARWRGFAQGMGTEFSAAPRARPNPSDHRVLPLLPRPRLCSDALAAIRTDRMPSALFAFEVSARQPFAEDSVALVREDDRRRSDAQRPRVP